MPLERRLLIAGAGGFGRELEAWLDAVPENDRDWRIHGFLDDNPGALSGYPSDYSIVGDIRSFAFQQNDLVVLAVGSPQGKKAVIEQLGDRVEFFRFIGPGSRMGKGVRLGRGVVVGVNCILTSNIDIGDFVTINSFSAIAHDVTIGAFASLMGNVMVNGNCVLGESVYVGSSATLIPGRRVGTGATIGAGAVVFTHVPAGSTYLGNPAKRFSDKTN